MFTALTRTGKPSGKLESESRMQQNLSLKQLFCGGISKTIPTKSQ